MKRRVSKIDLVYPLGWEVSFHPLAKRVERKTEAWLKDIGVIHDEAGMERFRKLTVWAYAGWPFPHGDPERLETIMGFLALWIFYDDIIEERDDGILRQVKDAVGGRPGVWTGGNPHYHGWRELGQRYARVMSDRWLDRHARRFEEWVLSVREECRTANHFRKHNRLPSPADHLKRRALNIGMIPNIDFIEYQMGWELPEDVLQEPEMKGLLWFSSEVVAITNDFFGVKKDLKNRWCNLVPCLAQKKKIPLDQAFRIAADMHNQRVLLIDRLGKRLAAKYPECPELQTWLERLNHIMYGFARWHAIAPRYDAVHELENGKTLRLGVRELGDELDLTLPSRPSQGFGNSVNSPRA